MEISLFGLRMVFRPLELAKRYYNAIVRLNYGDQEPPIGVKMVYWNVATLRVMGIREPGDFIREMTDHGINLPDRQEEVYGQAVAEAINAVTLMR
jgi:hypothetical protein